MLLNFVFFLCVVRGANTMTDIMLIFLIFDETLSHFSTFFNMFGFLYGLFIPQNPRTKLILRGDSWLLNTVEQELAAYWTVNAKDSRKWSHFIDQMHFLL